MEAGMTGGYWGFMEWYNAPPEPEESLWRIEPAHTEIRELACGIAAEVKTDHGVAVKVLEWERFDNDRCAYLLPVETEGIPGEVWVTANHIIMYRHNVKTKETDSFSSFCLGKLEVCLQEQLTRFVKELPRERGVGPRPHP